MPGSGKFAPRCKRCGRPVHGTADKPYEERAFCSSCMIELAEQHIPEKVKVSKGSSKKRQAKILSKWILLIGCSALILVNSVVLVRILAREKTKKFVPPEVSKDATLCLSNHEHISELLQQGELPPDSLGCPLTGTAYRVTIEGGDTTVLCPNPESHLLYGLRVSKKNPVPEVVR